MARTASSQAEVARCLLERRQKKVLREKEQRLLKISEKREKRPPFPSTEMPKRVLTGAEPAGTIPTDAKEKRGGRN